MSATLPRLAALGAVAAALLLAACSSDKPKPTPLEPLTPTIKVSRAWSASIGAIDFPLMMAARDGRVVAAASNGTVVALNSESGAELWRAQAGAPLTAGVGSDGRYSSVVTRDNEVVTFDGARQAWKQRVPARVVTAPLVAGERVFVLAVDRSVYAFDAVDGKRLWSFQRPGDPLTLAQAGVLTVARNQLLVGQGGRLVALDALRGTIAWDVPIAQSRGSNEVERLADLVGPATRQGDRVCARAFQNAVGCVDVTRQAALWTRNNAGAQAIGGSAERLVGADAVDRLSAWNTSNGEVAWTNEKLLHRGLSGVAALGSSVVMGDREGQLHFLSLADGAFQLRLPTDGKPVVGAPVLAGNTLLVATRGGGLFGLRPD